MHTPYVVHANNRRQLVRPFIVLIFKKCSRFYCHFYLGQQYAVFILVVWNYAAEQVIAMMCVDVAIGDGLHQGFKDIVGAHVKLIEHTDESKHTGKTSSSEKTIYLPVTKTIPQSIVVAKITTEEALALAVDKPVSKSMGLFGVANN